MSEPRELILYHPNRRWHLVRAPRGEPALSLCGRAAEGDDWRIGVRNPADTPSVLMCGHCWNVKGGETYTPAQEGQHDDD